MAALKRLYRWLVRRLPPRAAWMLWRAGVLVAARRRAHVAGPEVALAHVAWNRSEEELVALMERLVADSDAPPSHVLVISDCDAVHVAAARGCRVEYIPARSEWERAFPGGDYPAFLSARGMAIAAAYRIGRLETPDETPEPLSGGLRGFAGGRAASEA